MNDEQAQKSLKTEDFISIASYSGKDRITGIHLVTTQRLDRLPILGKIPAKTMTNQEARALYRQGEVVAV